MENFEIVKQKGTVNEYDEVRHTQKLWKLIAKLSSSVIEEIANS